MTHRKFPLFTALIAAAVVGILIFSFWEHENSWEPTDNTQHVELPKYGEVRSPLLIKGFVHTSYGEYGVRRILEAESFEVRPRRFWAINVKSINEAILVNARLSVYSQLHKKPDGELIDLAHALSMGTLDDELVRSRVLGRITRLIADKIIIELHQDEQKILVIKAAAALINEKKEGVKFFHAALHDVQSNRYLQAQTILWDTNHKVFVIPGEYIDVSPLGQNSGASVEVDMDFKLTPYDRSSNSKKGKIDRR